MSSADDVLQDYSEEVARDTEIPSPDVAPPEFSPQLRQQNDQSPEVTPINYGALMDPGCATAITYGAIQYAYDFFNQTLFASRLPGALITLRAERRTIAYFSRHRFASRSGQMIDEIAMNSSYFGLWPIECTLSALVHEMCHQAMHYTEGVKPNSLRSTYHSKQWADLMIGVGLFPSSTGRPGGKLVGECIGHYIIDGGNFMEACRALVSRQFRMEWYDRFPSADALNAETVATVTINPAAGAPGDADSAASPAPLGIPGEARAALRRIAEDLENARARARSPGSDPLPDPSEQGSPLPVVSSYDIEAIRGTLAPPKPPSKKPRKSSQDRGVDDPDVLEDQVVSFDLLLDGSPDEFRANTVIAIPELETGDLVRASDAPKPKRTKTSYMCPVCRSTVWGKPNLKLLCGCSSTPTQLEIVLSE